MKSLPQQELPRRDVWYVDDRGENLEVVMNDVLHVFEAQAMPWFIAMSDLEDALNVFEGQRERFEDQGIAVELLGGQPGSYNRASIASAIAFSLGQKQRAIAAWETMLANPYYARHEDLKGKAVAAIQWIRSEN